MSSGGYCWGVTVCGGRCEAGLDCGGAAPPARPPPARWASSVTQKEMIAIASTPLIADEYMRRPLTTRVAGRALGAPVKLVARFVRATHRRLAPSRGLRQIERA